MPDRLLEYSVFFGENSDKPEESGRAVMIEARGLSPLPPADDAEGGLISNPGFKIHGDDTYTFIPGLHGEPDTVTAQVPLGVPAASAAASANYKRCRLAGITHPNVKGNVLAVFYSGDGSSAGMGECLGLHVTQWGDRVRAGDVADGVVEEDLDVPVSGLITEYWTGVAAGEQARMFTDAAGWGDAWYVLGSYFLIYSEDYFAGLADGSDLSGAKSGSGWIGGWGLPI